MNTVKILNDLFYFIWSLFYIFPIVQPETDIIKRNWEKIFFIFLIIKP